MDLNTFKSYLLTHIFYAKINVHNILMNHITYDNFLNLSYDHDYCTQRDTLAMFCSNAISSLSINNVIGSNP